MSEKSEKFDSTRYKSKFAKEHYDRFLVTLPKGEKDVIKAYAAERGQSLNAFVMNAIREKMQ